MGGYFIYLAILILIPLWAQTRVKSTYSKYLKRPTSSQMTGYEVARKILDENGLFHVDIQQTKGTLSDHYDPRAKVVRLSKEIYHGHSMASSAVAAHEVGHAIQDEQEYAFMRFRSAIVPVANLGSRISIYLILAGLIFNMTEMFLFGIIFMSAAVLFQLVTLPVEFDASSRAMTQLVSGGIIRNDEERETKKVLNAAALTYVAAALVAVLELVRMIMIFNARD